MLSDEREPHHMTLELGITHDANASATTRGADEADPARMPDHKPQFPRVAAKPVVGGLSLITRYSSG